MSMTIDEIVRKIRKSQNGNVHTISAEEAYELADCIEKAIEVERIEWRKMLKEAKDAIEVLEKRCDAFEQCQTEDATCKESLQVGSVAKMREALSDACYAMFNFLKTRYGGYEEMAKALDKAKTALAAPPRNFDRFKTKEEAAWAYAGECNAFIPQSVLWQIGEWLDWLFAEVKGGEK